MTETTLTVTRATGYIAYLDSLDVLVDGDVKASLRRGQSVEIVVMPGAHRVGASLRKLYGPDRQISISQHESHHLKVIYTGRQPVGEDKNEILMLVDEKPDSRQVDSQPSASQRSPRQIPRWCLRLIFIYVLLQILVAQTFNGTLLESTQIGLSILIVATGLIAALRYFRSTEL